MSFRSHLKWWSLALTSAGLACSNESVGPSSAPPAQIVAMTDLSRTAPVASTIPAGLVVKVTDAAGKPVANVPVSFAVTIGNGSTTPRIASTDANGQATVAWTLGTIVGPNQVTASVTGVATQVTFAATGIAGAVNTITLTPLNPRLLSNVDSTRLTAVSLDVFGNTTSPTPTFIVRDPSLISVEANGVVRVLRRGSGTYVVATAGGKSDSVLVTVLAVGQSLCTAVADPVDLAVGQVVTDVSGKGFCVHASTASAEYAIIPFYNSGAPNATIQIEVRGQGLTPLPLSLPSTTIYRAPAQPQGPAPLIPDDAFEARMRARERAEAARRAVLAPPGIRSSRTVTGARASSTIKVPAIGDVMKFNVNAVDFCDRPDVRTGKVVAVTDKAIVVADTANPPGGFTDAEYRSIGVTFDTLVDPVDRAAFGAVTDIDSNGHVIIFFTRAVNELTTSGASGVVLGFFYRRDLYPKVVSPTETCEGSNFAEMMYVLVPDTGGVVNGNRQSKEQVVTAADGTVAHEYQHMINASRRMYVNNVSVFEELWLDEGLAHTAEELNFWRASGLQPRSNLDAAVYNNPKAAVALSTFDNNNFLRYRTYLQRTETQAPIGFDNTDADLQTRGAIWNFLRFVADHQPAGDENGLWFKLVNSNTTGVANLTNALGVAPYGLLRDWAISVFIDDNAPNVDVRFQQPSWNLRSVLTNGGMSLAFPLLPHVLADNASSSTLLAGNGVGFFRFSVASNQEALLTVTSTGQPLPATVQLAVVRVR